MSVAIKEFIILLLAFGAYVGLIMLNRYTIEQNVLQSQQERKCVKTQLVPMPTIRPGSEDFSYTFSIQCVEWSK